MKEIKIGIVDDHPFVIKGLEVVLSFDESLNLVWTASHEAEAMELMEEKPIDVLVVDLKLGDGTKGFEVLRMIAARKLEVRSIVLSAQAPVRQVREAALLGASGYFSKSESGEELLEAIRILGNGPATTFLGPYKALAKQNIYLDLSTREKQVLLLIAQGKSNSEVANSLGLKLGTVKTHLENIYKKLGVNNRIEALRAALLDGYFSLEDIQ